MDDTGRGDTRARIQSVALELFTEQGYETTSLREIAERLGVTKAALYYHFKSKDEIVDSIVTDHGKAVDGLLDWVNEQPRTPDLRTEFLRRYSDLLRSRRHHEVMRFFDRNQAALRSTPVGEKIRGRMGRVLDVIVDADAPPQQQIRAGLAIWALHTSWFVVRDPNISDDDRQSAALEVALDLVVSSAVQ